MELLIIPICQEYARGVESGHGAKMMIKGNSAIMSTQMFHTVAPTGTLGLIVSPD
jgi:hypothetical protein